MLSNIPKIISVHCRKYSSFANSRVLENIKGQTVWAGKGSIKSMFANEPMVKAPFVLADIGRFSSLEPVIKDSMRPQGIYKVTTNPTSLQLFESLKALSATNSDGVVGLGGGATMDLAKALAWVKAVNAVDSGKYKAGSPEDVEQLVVNARTIMNELSSNNGMATYTANLLKMSMIPTTSGTGSEGGKSSVITSLDSQRKLIVGHPSLMPHKVALDPTLTVDMPPHLTAATGIDALMHCMEAYLVTTQDGLNDGCTQEEINAIDAIALKGIEMIGQNLPTAFSSGTELEARLNMQIAALYGAKAFRKGDLGAVHATAHTIGARFHLHHGEAIARMTLPVLSLSFTRASLNHPETAAKFSKLYQVLASCGFRGQNSFLSGMEQFLKVFKMPYGLEGLKHDNDFDGLAAIAIKDPCGTNPIKFDLKDYTNIFKSAAKQL